MEMWWLTAGNGQRCGDGVADPARPGSNGSASSAFGVGRIGLGAFVFFFIFFHFLLYSTSRQK